MITSKTPLYKAVKKALGKDADWKQISRELCAVHQELPKLLKEGFQHPFLNMAFVWDDTQQGFRYWHSIAIRIP